MTTHQVDDGQIPRKNSLRDSFSSRALRLLQRLRRTWIRLNCRRDYACWRARNEPDQDELTRQRRLAGDLDAPSTFLVQMAISEQDLEGMSHTIDHLRSQTYPWWQLRIHTPEESNDQVQAVLRAGYDHEARISTHSLGENPVDVPTEDPGDHADILVMLQPGDCLAKSALWAVVNYLENHPEDEMVYTDEDQLDSRGRRHGPWFKPDWSPELLYSLNYLQPLFIRRQILNGDIENVLQREGEIDWSSLWEVSIGGRYRLGHLPKVLLHRLTPRDEAVQNSGTGQDLHAHWVEGHFRKLGKKSVNVTRPAADGLRISWATGNPLVSIIIPTRNSHQILDRCLRSLIEKTAYPTYEILILDSGKPGATRDLSAYSSSAETPIKVFPSKSPFNYSRTNNEGARAANGDLFLFLNDDVQIIAGDWLEEMVRWAELPEIGAVGAKLLYPDMTIQHCGVILGMGGHANHVFQGANEGDDGPYGLTVWYRNFLAVTGACMMVRREIFESVGGFDEDYELAFSDIDLCLRIVAEGLRVIVTPHARLIHHEGSSRGRYMPVEDLVLARDALLPRVKSGDPYFNPNLSYASPYPRVAWTDEDRVARLDQIVSQAQVRKA